MQNSWGFALDTSAIRLMRREDLVWMDVAKEWIDAAGFEERMAAMVAQIGHDASADLFLSRDRILYADVEIDPGSATRQEIERALCEQIPHQIGELDLDWEVTEQGTVRVAAVALETLKETLDFASEHGIRVGRLSSLADPADFPRFPDFCGRSADVPLPSLIENAPPDAARKILIAENGDGQMPLPGADGHRFPQRPQAAAVLAVALAAALGFAALLWNAMPPGLETSEQPLDERSESDLAAGGSPAEPEFAAPENVDATNDLLRRQPPVVHADSRQRSDLWRRSERQAPSDDTGIASAPLPTTPVPTQPHIPPLPQAGHDAPSWNALPPEVQTSERPLGERSGSNLAAGAHPIEPEVATQQSVDAARDLLRQRAPAVQADLRQLSDLWRRSALQAPSDDAGITAAPLTTALALAQLQIPPRPQAGPDAPLVREARPPEFQASEPPLDERFESDLASDGPPAEPEVVTPESVDAANDLLRQQAAAVHADTQQLSDLWRRSELQALADAGIVAAPLTTTLALTQPHIPARPQAERDAPAVLDAPPPADPDPLAPATAGRPLPHDGPPTGTRPEIDRPAYALREIGDVQEGSVHASPAAETSASPSPAPPEFQPRMRPDGFAEHVERLTYGGRTIAELATLRAKPRPVSAQQLAAGSVETSRPTNGSWSPAPRLRPDNFGAVVAEGDIRRRLVTAARAHQALEIARNAESALVADAEPELRHEDLTNRSTPSRSTAARRATIPNAIRLNEVNLVGVYGTTEDRRALVRLPSGRYVRVRVGDRVDGGRVGRITESELFYQKGGQTVSLRVPRG